MRIDIYLYINIDLLGSRMILRGTDNPVSPPGGIKA